MWSVTCKVDGSQRHSRYMRALTVTNWLRSMRSNEELQSNLVTYSFKFKYSRISNSEIHQKEAKNTNKHLCTLKMWKFNWFELSDGRSIHFHEPTGMVHYIIDSAVSSRGWIELLDWSLIIINESMSCDHPFIYVCTGIDSVMLFQPIPS